MSQNIKIQNLDAQTKIIQFGNLKKCNLHLIKNFLYLIYSYYLKHTLLIQHTHYTLNKIEMKHIF